MSRIVLAGYYGFGNAGDEAILAAMLVSLRRQIPGAEYGVLSADPSSTSGMHDVPAFHRARPQEVLGTLRRCDLFISGGGSLLQDVTSLSSLLFYLTQIRLARLLRRRVMIYAQGVGPLLRPAARRLTAQILRDVDWITVRDDESAVLLRRIGLSGAAPPIEVTADPVFSLEPAAVEWAESELCPALASSSGSGQSTNRRVGIVGGAKAGPGGARALLGISVREWPGLEPRLGALAEGIRSAAAEMALIPVFFPLQRAQDLAACRQLADRSGGYVLPGDYAPGEWMALAGQMQLFFGMRLHALIFAAARGVPVVGLSYDPKVTALLARLGQAPAASVADLDAESIRRALCETWNDRVSRSVQMLNAARELAVAAEDSARRAAELLGMKKAAVRHGR